MADQVRVTVEEVRRVAELANLELTPDEEVAMLRDLNAILDHVAELNQLDTSSVAPMAQVSEVLLAGLAAESAGDGSALRADKTAASLSRESVLDFAPESDGAFFKVPKVIER